MNVIYCVDFDVQLTVKPKIILRSPSLVKLDEGTSATLFCVSSGSKFGQYYTTWRKDSKVVQKKSGLSSNYTISTANKDDTGTYTCTNTAASVPLDSANYTVVVIVRCKLF